MPWNDPWSALSRGLCCLLLCASASIAHASDSPAAPVDSWQRRVHYRAVTGCPDEAAFLEAVARRGLRETGARVDIDVTIEKAPSGFVGTLRVNGAPGESEPRQASAEQCEAVVDAMAAVTTLVLDAAPEKQAAVPEPTPQIEPPTKPKTEPRPEHFVGASVVGGEASSRSFHVDEGTAHYDAQIQTTVQGGLVFGFLPGGTPMPRLDLVMVSTPFLTLPSGEQSIVGVMTRLRLSATLPTTFTSGEARTDIYGAGLAIGLCLTPHFDTRGFMIVGCVEYGGALFDMRTHMPEEDDLRTFPGFATVGLNVNASYALFSHFNVGLSAGAESYMGTHQVVSRAGARVLEMKNDVSGLVMASLGFHF